MEDQDNRQGAGDQVERDMIAFLMQFAPTNELRVSDVKQIALYARNVALDHFYDAATE